MNVRDSKTIGKVCRDPAIMHGEWVVAGTRIPTWIVASYVKSGSSDDEIIEQYPSLTPEDIAAAMRHEVQRDSTKRRSEDAA
jgi:uncharacterized protein (DUF433 family)